MIGLYFLHISYAVLQWFLLSIPCSSGVHCGKGGQQQCSAVSRLHQHQEQDELPVRKSQRQRLPGPTHFRLPAANAWQLMGRHQPTVSDWSLGASFRYRFWSAQIRRHYWSLKVCSNTAIMFLRGVTVVWWAHRVLRPAHLLNVC